MLSYVWLIMGFHFELASLKWLVTKYFFFVGFSHHSVQDFFVIPLNARVSGNLDIFSIDYADF